MSGDQTRAHDSTAVGTPINVQVDLRMLECFVAVAEELSFRKASERLSVAQPAVSRTIRALEQRLGVDVFMRSSRRVELTSAGDLLLQLSRDLLARHDDLVAEIAIFVQKVKSDDRPLIDT